MISLAHTQIDFVKTVEHAIEFFVCVERCTYRFLHEINLIDKLQNVKLMSDIGIVRCMLCVCPMHFACVCAVWYTMYSFVPSLYTLHDDGSRSSVWLWVGGKE